MENTKKGSSDYIAESTAIFLDNGSGEPGNEVKFFRPTDHIQHFLARMKSLKFGHITGKWVFTGVNTFAGSDFKIAEVALSGLVANQFTAVLSLDKDWPIGFYRADLIVAEELITSINYIVTPALDELKTESVRLLKDNGSKEPGDEVKNFETTDRTIHFEVTADGLVPGGTQMRWILFGIENPEDDPIQIKEVSTEFNYAVNIMSSSFSIAQDWSVGSYMVEFYLNENLFETILFTVE